MLFLSTHWKSSYTPRIRKSRYVITGGRGKAVGGPFNSGKKCCYQTVRSIEKVVRKGLLSSALALLPARRRPHPPCSLMLHLGSICLAPSGLARPCETWLLGGWLSNWRPSTEHDLGKWAAPPTGVLLLPSLPGPPRKLGIFAGFSHTAPRTCFYSAASDCGTVCEQDQSESSGLHSLQTHGSTRVLWTQNQKGQMP